MHILTFLKTLLVINCLPIFAYGEVTVDLINSSQVQAAEAMVERYYAQNQTSSPGEFILEIEDPGRVVCEYNGFASRKARARLPHSEEDHDYFVIYLRSYSMVPGSGTQIYGKFGVGIPSFLTQNVQDIRNYLNALPPSQNGYALYQLKVSCDAAKAQGRPLRINTSTGLVTVKEEL